MQLFIKEKTSARIVKKIEDTMVHLIGAQRATDHEAIRENIRERLEGLLTILGLNGGWISLSAIFSQSILRKNWLPLMSCSPFSPHPRRFAGFLIRN